LLQVLAAAHAPEDPRRREGAPRLGLQPPLGGADEVGDERRGARGLALDGAPEGAERERGVDAGAGQAQGEARGVDADAQLAVARLELEAEALGEGAAVLGGAHRSPPSEDRSAFAERLRL